MEDGKKQLTLIGKNHGQVEEIQAYYALKDGEGNTEETVLGQACAERSRSINVKSYNKQLVNVYLVPLAGSTVNLNNVGNILNNIYKPAVTQWNVTVLSPYTNADLNFDNNKFADGGTAFLSNYTSDMNTVIRGFKNAPGASIEKNAYYIFIAPYPTEGSRAGYMPFKRQFGFVFTQNTGTSADNLARVIAHELGHGAFCLYHTFSAENDHTLPQSTTDNLMDYNGGTGLFKYQWDLVHDPKGGLYLFQEEEEGAYTLTPVDKQHTLLFNHIYDNNNIKNMAYLSTIEKAIAAGNNDMLELAYTASESRKWTASEKEWIDQWKIRAMNSDDVFNDVIKAIKETGKNKKISKIVLRPKHIYIGKYIYDGIDYPVAIYGNGDKTVMTNAFTKIQVTDAKELESKENIKHISSVRQK